MKRNLPALLLLAMVFAIQMPFFAQSPTLSWVKTLDNSSQQYDYTGLLLDSASNVYLGGTFVDAYDADPGPGTTIFPANGNEQLYFEELDSAGNLVWAKAIGGTGNVHTRTMTRDHAGNLIAAGVFNGTIDFDPGAGTFNITAISDLDLFVVKLTPIGVFEWARSMSMTDTIEPTAVSADPAGNVYVAGYIYGTGDLDPGPGVANFTTNSTFYNSFLLKLDANGQTLNPGVFPGGGSYLQYMEADSFGNVICMGELTDTVDLAPNASTYNHISYGVTCFKLRSDGSVAWVRDTWGFSQMSFDVGPDGSVNYGGSFNGTIDLDPGLGVVNVSCNSGFFDNPFAVQLDSAGLYQFGFQLNSPYFFGIGDIDVDGLGYSYYHGQYLDSIDFDPGPGSVLVIDPGTHYYVLKLDSYGNYVWGGQVGLTTFNDMEIVVGNHEEVFLAGNSYVGGDMDPGPGTWNFQPFYYQGLIVTKWLQDSCSNWAVHIDSISDVTCLTLTGNAAATGIGGVPPYSFVWGTTPATIDSFATFTAPGLYGLTAMDARGCTRQLGIMVGGPLTNGFDLSADVVSWQNSPVLDGFAIIDVYNDGCTDVSGQYRFVLDDTLTFQYALSPPSSISGDTLSWSFSNFSYDDGHFRDTIYYDVPDSMTNNDILCFSAIVDPIAGDNQPLDNVLNNYCFQVRTAFDPNEKTVYPYGECQEHYVLQGTPLRYTLKFQNTGFAPALDVVLLDRLDSAFAIQSLRIIDASHPVQTTLHQGNVLRFEFRNIMLPDSFTSEPESHGYVVFEISPINNLPNGTEVQNYCDIYFDNNPPVLTNNTWTTFVASIPACPATAVNSQENSEPLSLYPNPSDGKSKLNTSTKIGDIEVRNSLGQVMFHQKQIAPNDFELDARNWNAGIYFVIVTDDQGATHVAKWFIRR
jgi:uncharacterized repeat protein (TIGR01451 family)